MLIISDLNFPWTGWARISFTSFLSSSFAKAKYKASAKACWQNLFLGHEYLIAAYYYHRHMSRYVQNLYEKCALLDLNFIVQLLLF